MSRRASPTGRGTVRRRRAPGRGAGPRWPLLRRQPLRHPGFARRRPATGSALRVRPSLAPTARGERRRCRSRLRRRRLRRAAGRRRSRCHRPRPPRPPRSARSDPDVRRPSRRSLHWRRRKLRPCSGGRQSRRLRAPKRALGSHRYHARGDGGFADRCRKAGACDGDGGEVLTGRVVLVTGGGRGIGRAIALGLEDAHATVTVVDGEFASRADVEAAFAAAREAAGPIDAVVHAFIDPTALTNETLADTAEADWDRRCEAMLRAALLCCQAAGRELSARGGRLVLVTPTIALTGAAGFVPYATAVEGMRAMAKSAARQWGERGITVNCVAPPVELLGPARAAPDGLALTERPLGRDPDARTDVAPVVALLAAAP